MLNAGRPSTCRNVRSTRGRISARSGNSTAIFAAPASRCDRAQRAAAAISSSRSSNAERTARAFTGIGAAIDTRLPARKLSCCGVSSSKPARMTGPASGDGKSSTERAASIQPSRRQRESNARAQLRNASLSSVAWVWMAAAATRQSCISFQLQAAASAVAATFSSALVPAELSMARSHTARS
jgi:hypothetical protein